ncbi:follicle-stimulating hormone receptor [Periophthalmus magnuspinnatus]|uniref:follicle-stimulating hormone receptor n=1 Tax=Periophthalmus magnuspinnatus TaxID=409849 RepID=UPI00145B12B8|nr:follicle-stimulating hormone receptor [Periophthalmus magnuspinnatus]
MFGVLVMGTIMVQMGQTCGLEMFLARWGQKDSNCELKGPDVKQIPTNISINTKHLEVKQTLIGTIPGGVFSSLQQLQKITIQHNEQLESIEPYAFANLPRLSSVFVSGNAALKKMGALAFFNLPELTEIHITNAKHLQQMDRGAFKNIPKLRYLLIANTGLNMFPDLGHIHSAARDFIFEFHDNSYITEVPPNAFRGLCSQTITEIRLSRNSIERVARDAFNGTRMRRLFLGGNTGLTHFSPDAFAGSSQLVVLNISHTALSSVPSSILNSLQKIIAKSAINLRQLPAFTRLAHAELTYPSHCCSFDKMINNRSKKHPLCSHDQVHTDPHFVRVCLSNSTCFPIPDAFNPCEDIMTTVSLRVLIWVISVLALLGNTAVLLVLLGTRAKLTVPRFLMCHLAFADLCMGVYLVVIATVDMFTRGKYYNYAIDWQTGLGCSAAGFFTVFASELSVFTLTAITLERWHTITHALRLDRKLRLRHACFVMTGGWVFALIAALLPTLGVSSYGKVSICLPMDVESILAQIYVVSLLLLNVLAFLCVCACYLSIYLTIRNPSSAHAHADTRIAKRMALLIFTDFLCMAPISFFALSAALKLPLITVTDAKFLLVLFYPINSCSNPFLYAFCTRTFRRDFFVMAARFGVCKTRAQIYRTETSSCQQPAWTSPKSSHIMLYSLANTLHSIDSKQDF